MNSIATYVRQVASNVRWRLKINRWIGKAIYSVIDTPKRIRHKAIPTVNSPLLEAMLNESFTKRSTKLALPEIDLAQHSGKALGKPFVDVADSHWDAVVTAFVDLLADPEIANLVNGYFGGRPSLWNVALNYSDPSQGTTDSQLWHFDYGDVRQLHLTVYFSDVDIECGPFTFLPAPLSDQIRRDPFVIERMTDADIAEHYAFDAQTAAVRLTGERGDVYVNDPGRLMHQGARCAKPRLVMFVTFTSPSPMTRGGRMTISRAKKALLAAAYRKRRPDGELAQTVFS